MGSGISDQNSKKWKKEIFPHKIPTSDEIIDYIDLRNSNRRNDTWLEELFRDITTASVAKQLIGSGITGWIAGFVFTKVSKTAAATLAGSLFLFQVAQHKGYININWSNVNRDLDYAKRQLNKHTKHRLPSIYEESQRFIKDNMFIATGFTGGFLLGIAST